MLNHQSAIGAAFCLGTPPLVCGCGQKQMVSTQVPQQPGESEMAGVEKGPLPKSGHYLVVRNDCLWAIAGKSKVYGDPFLWPELFKTNRDQIQDPDLIYPRQELRVGRGYSTEDANHARQLAMSTPKYVPHSKPRESLPLDYF